MTKFSWPAAALSALLLTCSTPAFAQQASVQPGYQSFQNQGEVPTLNLPQQYDPTIGQTSEPTSIDIVRNQGEAQIVDPNAAPPPSENEQLDAERQQNPVTGGQSTNSVRSSTAATANGKSDSKRKYVKGMMLEGKVRVADGHSLLVGTDAVRLNGVEAPGQKQLCFTDKGTAWRCGIAAQNRLKAIAEGRKAICRVDAPAGNGAAATCSVQGIPDVSRILLQEGLVVANNFAPPIYLALQNQARSDQTGMWVGTFQNPAEWRKKNR
jgi:endonuclease YncB( thermonuclease family)